MMVTDRGISGDSNRRVRPGVSKRSCEKGWRQWVLARGARYGPVRTAGGVQQQDRWCPDEQDRKVRWGNRSRRCSW